MHLIVLVLFHVILFFLVFFGGFLAKKIELQSSELKEFWFFVKREHKIKYYLIGHGILAIVFYFIIGNFNLLNPNYIPTFNDIGTSDTVQIALTPYTINYDSTIIAQMNIKADSIVKDDSIFLSTDGLLIISHDSLSKFAQILIEKQDLGTNSILKSLNNIKIILGKLIFAFILGFSLVGVASQIFIPSLSGGKPFSFSTILNPYYDDIISNVNEIVPANISRWATLVSQKLKEKGENEGSIRKAIFNYLRHHKNYQTEKGKLTLAIIIDSLHEQTTIENIIHKAIEEVDIKNVLYSLRKFKVNSINYNK